MGGHLGGLMYCNQKGWDLKSISNRRCETESVNVGPNSVSNILLHIPVYIVCASEEMV